MVTVESSNKPNSNGARENRIHNWSGIKFFNGFSLPDESVLSDKIPSITADFLRENMHVWRPEETVEAAPAFFGLQRPKGGRLGLQVIGEPQSGKGTVLFGLSEICDVLGVGYVFIDGHHQEVPGEIVAEAINRAQSLGIPVFFDSTDYLFLRSRNTGRSISSDAQLNRVPIIMEAIDKANIPIAITSHDGEWVREFLNLELRDQYAIVLGKFSQYTISPHLRSKKSIHRFLIDHRMPEKAAGFLLNVENDDFARQALLKYTKVLKSESTDALSSDATFTPDDIFCALKAFSVLKDIARVENALVLPLIETAMRSDLPLIERQLAISDLGGIILRLENKRRNLVKIRRKKMAVP